MKIKFEVMGTTLYRWAPKDCQFDFQYQSIVEFGDDKWINEDGDYHESVPLYENIVYSFRYFIDGDETWLIVILKPLAEVKVYRKYFQ